MDQYPQNRAHNCREISITMQERQLKSKMWQSMKVSLLLLLFAATTTSVSVLTALFRTPWNLKKKRRADFFVWYFFLAQNIFTSLLRFGKQREAPWCIMMMMERCVGASPFFFYHNKFKSFMLEQAVPLSWQLWSLCNTCPLHFIYLLPWGRRSQGILNYHRRFSA